MSVREELAAAVEGTYALDLEGSAVEEAVKGHHKYVQTTRPGAVLVRRNRTEYPNRFGGVAFWDLYVIGPQDQAAAEIYFDALAPQLVEALKPVLAVDAVIYQRTDFGEGAIPTAVISGHREED